MLTTLMLALTFMQAPFEHFHEHEENNHHPHTGILHLHLLHHHLASSKAIVAGIDPDDDAVFQNSYVAVSRDVSIPIFLTISVYDLPPIKTSKPYIDRVISGGHDPPLRLRTAPRAPPV